MKDTELVIRLHKGDIEAFNAIYWKYHQNLYSNIFKLVKDPDATRDILQEVFIVFWEKRLTIDANRPVSNWLFVVSYNKSIDHLKKKLKQSLSYDAINEIIENIDEDEAGLQEKQLALLGKAIEVLSPQRRKVFELCKIQRKSYEETANELKISKHTVKEYLSSAIMTIKEYLRTNGETGSLIILLAGMFFIFRNFLFL